MKRTLRILCADDNAVIGYLMVRLFSAVGHLAEHAFNGRLAWERMLRDLDYFDVLITDHDMPQLDGLELVRRLRERDYRGKIVVHSNALRNEDTEAYRALSVDLMIPKATSGDEFVNAIETLCGGG
jgi:CheY-like chemotaxis protein